MQLRLIISLIPIFIISGCASKNNSDELYQFQWEESAENTTGRAKNLYAKDHKHRGMSVFGWHDNFKEKVDPIVQQNIEGVAIVPWLFQKTDETKVIRPLDAAPGVWTHYDSIYMKSVRALHDRDMHVFLKPHLWMHEGWRSNIKLENTAEWNRWFDSYRMHMIHYAKLAEYLDVNMYCIGTELKTTVKALPDRWLQLIKEIKSIYKGKITYAANWDDDLNDIPFWAHMDYIGIQAYYPLTNSKSPSLHEIKNGWVQHKQKLRQLSEKYDKQILFSEVGYRSDAKATIKPWEWDNKVDTTGNFHSLETQNLAYEAMFQELWHEPWFAGTYFWQWHLDHTRANPNTDLDFTPRHKPAMNTMAKWYGREH